ncbi:MAG: hypothetical protein HeimC2_42250 [Candidatus Heimdallarchaeota archaeon LC_2]|nr:MAG: hypothetical protein HeimC2_42250 [Candidatus Heimdallarchaeota archaeon LC_2]
MEDKDLSLNQRITDTIHSNFSSKPVQGTSLDEVDLLDPTQLSDWDPAANPVSLSPFEDADSIADLIHGLEIPKLAMSEYYGEYNFGAVDGSSGRIVRQTLAAVFVQSAFASNSINASMDVTRLMDNDFKIIPFTDYFLKDSAIKHPNIVGYDPNKDIMINVDSRAGYEQAILEVNTIPLVMKKYGDNLHFLGIDGPLYSKSNISLASKTVDKALNNLIGMFAIVKRTGSSAVLNKMREQLKTNPNKALKQILKNQYFNDTSFFARYLQEGHRSLFFEDRSSKEEKAGLPDELTRVCCYLKMDNRKVVRLEMPKKVAYEHGDLTMGNDIANMVYWQARESSKPLPNYFHLADEAAKLTRTKIEGYKTPIDEFLKSIGDSTIEFQEWKGYT